MQQTGSNFSYFPAYGENKRLFIKSTCKGCGEFRLVDLIDGSLEKWEQEHKCSQ